MARARNQPGASEEDLLFLTSPPMRGPAVREIQRALKRHGFAPGPVDGVFGSATEAAVQSFQYRCGLEADGVVGPRTREALTMKQLPPEPPAPKTPGLGALAWMIAHDGMTEAPAGSNRCPVTAEYGLVGPWCMMAVSLAFKNGGRYVLGKTKPTWGYWANKGFAYCPAFEAWAKARGFWLGHRPSDVRPGDVILFQFDADREPDHVGIVERVAGAGRYVTREGNTSGEGQRGSQANGGMLTQRNRSGSIVYGFARMR